MQELIDYVNGMLANEGWEETVINKATSLIKKEKEQITNAYSDGAKGGGNGTKGQHKFGYVSIQTKEKYYNETYNQKKS